MNNYIIIGAGSAGCVLANRLSAEPACQVLLLEAGGADSDPDIRIPGRWTKLLRSTIDWSYQSEPQIHLNDRRIDLNRGKVLGGSSSLNGMVYIRGHRWDYDRWAELGNEQWSYADVLPYFQRAERFEGEDADAVYGRTGPLVITQIPDVLGQFERCIAAGVQAGMQHNGNFNGAEQAGVGVYHHTYKDGKRQSVAEAYLKPILGRPNLHVETHAQVTRILFAGKRAVGVEYTHDHQLKQAGVDGEIILCGGAINSPQTLLCSGIGPADQLRALGIPVVVDLPGVGENLQDHPMLTLTFQSLVPTRVDSARSGAAYRDYLQNKTGALLSTRTFAGGFWRTRPDLPAPDMQFYFTVGEVNDPCDFAIGLSMMRPQSRGFIQLRTASPFDYPIIQPNYLAEAEDIRVYIASVRMVRQLLATPAFASLIERELTPGADAQSDAAITTWMRTALGTTWHYSGTCKMGSDPLAVVNDRLQVHGSEGLRVVDASIMPEIVGGNTNAPVIMIAEKAADLIMG